MDHFLYSLITFSLVYKSRKTSHLGSRFGGYRAPKSVSEPKISKFSFICTAHVQTVRPRGATMVLYCITRALYWKPLPVFKRPYNFVPQGPWGAPNPKKLPQFPKILSGRGQFFLFHYTGTTKPHHRKNLVTVTWPTSPIKILKFRRKLTSLSYEKSLKKKLTTCVRSLL